MRAAWFLSVLLFGAVQAPRNKIISGLKHSSVTLLTSYDPLSVKNITWKHKTPEHEWRIIKIQDGVLKEKLDNRYKPARNGTELVIDNLIEKDNGVYTAEVTLEDGETENESFNVRIYEPVPPPQITSTVMRMRKKCNATLHCSVPSNTSDFLYTWKYRQQDSENWTTEHSGSTMLPLDRD
ncbi:SLAM family member 5-like, partial [Dendropsophus ebraccatus]|uniref:SLAM family member 5-like n=1 Tax=Dendropsophus ebraccatus TaxID=150705 RepID=UPI0038319ED0